VVLVVLLGCQSKEFDQSKPRRYRPWPQLIRGVQSYNKPSVRPIFDGGCNKPSIIISVTLDAPNHSYINWFLRQSIGISYALQWNANPCNMDNRLECKPSLLILLHCPSIWAMIFPVGLGWQGGIISPSFYLIDAARQSPLSFASGCWSPQHSIPSLAYWLTTGWSHDMSHALTSLVITRPLLMVELIWPPAMGARHSAWWSSNCAT
jgi:hypothetical protein